MPMNIITAGIDLAKNVSAVHGVDDNGKPVLVKPRVSRTDLLPLLAIAAKNARQVWSVLKYDEDFKLEPDTD